MEELFVLVEKNPKDFKKRFIGIDLKSGGYPYLTTLAQCKKFKVFEDAQSYNTLSYDCKIMKLVLNDI